MSLEYLYSLGYNQIKPGLERVQKLLQKLDNPQDNFKSIHVAGTNGKGSVCAYMTSILMQQGYTVGTFTSPHLLDFRERIRINNKMIPYNHLHDMVEKLKPFVTDQTFFEVVTSLAFLYFSEQKVDYAVVETGMGGRLDATNEINPQVSVITNISIDHSHFLGNSFEEIAHEKSGIIKDAPVITPSADYVTKDCDLRIAPPYNGPISMNGSFQRENAGLAKKAAQVLEITEDAIAEGIKNTYWPGRLDYIDNLVLDAAHNVESIRKLVKEVNCDVFILGIMKDKDIEGICRELPDARIIACKPNAERSADPEDIAKHIDCEIVPDLCEAIKKVKDKRVCVTGSIFTVAEAFECLGLQPFDTQVD